MSSCGQEDRVFSKTMLYVASYYELEQLNMQMLLKGQCISIKALKLCIISLAVK